MELITKAKEILIAVWEDGATTYPTSGDALDYVIADTLSVSQDDPEEQTFEFETSDTPETSYTAGQINVDLNNAELSEKFMTDIMGWEKTTTPAGVVAPESHKQRYVALQVKFSDTCYFFIPRISIAPKLTMESVKTSLVYGSLSGTATNTTVGNKRTSIGKFTAPILTKSA